LATVNAELQAKVADLSRANNDMNNLLAGTGIATVFVDFQLHVMKFTPAATKVINLIQSDIGRPVGHIVPNLLGYDSLTADIQAVLDTLIPKEMELQTANGRWFTMHIQPYRTIDNTIEGAVITFVDITSARKLQEELGESENRLRSVLFHSPMLISEFDLDGQFLLVNPAVSALFKLPQHKIVGKTISDLLTPDIARIYKERMAAILETGAPVKGEDYLQTEKGMHRFLTTMFPLLNDAGRICSIGTIAYDIQGGTEIQTGSDT
jgi:two-component system, chemotaxis family, CheB/CheR fusion protein